jgi:hypothetical protein
MKTLVATLALALTIALAGPALAGSISSAKTQADCEKAGGVWSAGTKTCTRESNSSY